MPIKVNGVECTLAGGVQETTQTTGTGTYSLDGAATNRRTFVAAIGSGVTTVYTARLGSEFETGIGTITSGAPATLSRDTILESSNADAAVDWGAGVKDIFCDAAAAVFHSLQSQVDGNDTDIATNVADIDALETLTAQITKDGSNQYTFDPGAVNRNVIQLRNSAGSPEEVVLVLRIDPSGHGKVEVRDSAGAAQAVVTGSGGGRIFIGGDESTGTEIAVASGTVAYDGSVIASAAHGLGAVPTSFAWRLRCDVTEGGYAVNDEAEIGAWQTQADADDHICFWANSTEIGVSGNDRRLANKTTGAVFTPTAANWTWKWYARVL